VHFLKTAEMAVETLEIGILVTKVVGGRNQTGKIALIAADNTTRKIAVALVRKPGQIALRRNLVPVTWPLRPPQALLHRRDDRSSSIRMVRRGWRMSLEKVGTRMDDGSRLRKRSSMDLNAEEGVIERLTLCPRQPVEMRYERG